MEWVTSLQQDWTRVSRGAALAGHGDLRSGLGNYMAGWPLVFSAHVTALLTGLSPKPKYLAMFGIDPAGLRQARKRAIGCDLERGATGSIFDSWQWIARRLARTQNAGKDSAKSASVNDTSQSPARADSSGRASTEPALCTMRDELLYLTLRILGQEPDEALENCDMPLRRQPLLEARMPSADNIALATNRARGEVQTRGKVANIALAEGEMGRALVGWQMHLSQRDRVTLVSALLRKPSCLEKFDQESSDALLRIVHGLPSGLCIDLQRGESHITSQEWNWINATGGRVQLHSNPQIGAKPIVAVALLGRVNRVQSSRLTSVSRAIALAISAITTFESH